MKIKRKLHAYWRTMARKRADWKSTVSHSEKDCSKSSEVPLPKADVEANRGPKLLFEKIEWSPKNDHEWRFKNDHRWVICIPSKTIKRPGEAQRRSRTQESCTKLSLRELAWRTKEYFQNVPFVLNLGTLRSSELCFLSELTDSICRPRRLGRSHG